MAGFGRIRILPAALLALMLVSTSRAQGTIDFSFYPKGAQQCLYDAADGSKCESATVVATNSCFCRNGGSFVTRTAACVGRSSPGDVQKVYDTMRDACSTSQTPLSISEDEFMEAARGDATTTRTTRTRTTSTTSTTSSASTTETGSTTLTTTTTTTGTGTGTATTTAPPATSTAAEKEESSGLSKGAMAGVIAGAVGGCAVLAAIGFFLFRQRKKAGEESHPMLPQFPQYQQHDPHFSMAPSGRESTAYYGHVSSTMAPSGRESTAYQGSPPSTAGWPKRDWNVSPDVRNSVWESAAHLSYLGSGPLAPSSSPPPIQELDGIQQFPPGSVQAPAEMGSTPVATSPPPPPPAPAAANMPQYQPYIPPEPHPGVGWNPHQR